VRVCSEQRYQPDGHTIGTEEEAPSTETPGVSLLALVSEVDVHRAQQIADELPILFRYEHALRLEIEEVRQTIGPVFAQPPMPGKEPRALVFVIGGELPYGLPVGLAVRMDGDPIG
jgi:hypothetical protein